jgi:hypothetical protein
VVSALEAPELEHRRELGALGGGPGVSYPIEFEGWPGRPVIACPQCRHDEIEIAGNVFLSNNEGDAPLGKPMQCLLSASDRAEPRGRLRVSGVDKLRPRHGCN